MASPYTAAARDYLEAGWSPIPLPYKEKDPPPNKPVSFTGADGAYVTEEQLRAWLKPKARCSAGNLSYPPGNIALRLPRNVIGVDVDAYGTKRGAETLEAAEEAWGPLPPTWVSGSREDGVSGIRLYPRAGGSGLARTAATWGRSRATSLGSQIRNCRAIASPGGTNIQMVPRGRS
jgi:hypothetical protein